MKKPSKSADTRKPVTQVVHSIMEHARAQRADGPSSGLFGRDAQLSSAMTRAGVFLAKLDKASHNPKRSSALRNAIGALSTAAPPRRRSWFFGGAPASAMPNAKRIEQVLQSATKDGRRLVLDVDLSAGAAANDEIECRLPAGAVDPVCEPR
jgi:hypothetical protein